MTVQNKQQGSVVHIIVITVLVLAILGLLGYVFWNNFVNKKTATTATTSTSQSQTTNAKLPNTHSSTIGGFSINYPSDWTLKTSSDTSDPNWPDEKTTLTSPSGTVLLANVHNDARGGTCPPDNNVPFKAGNNCPSLEHLSAEKLPITNVYALTGKAAYETAPEDIYLVTTKYGDTSGKLTFTIGAENVKGGEATIALNAPEMGVLSSDLYIAHDDQNYKQTQKNFPNIYLYAQSDSESFLTSKDGETVKDIIRSLTFN